MLGDLVDRLCDSDHLVAGRLDGHAQYSPRLVAGPQVHRRVEPIVLYIVSRRSNLIAYLGKLTGAHQKRCCSS